MVPSPLLIARIAVDSVLVAQSHLWFEVLEMREGSLQPRRH